MAPVSATDLLDALIEVMRDFGQHLHDEEGAAAVEAYSSDFDFVMDALFPDHLDPHGEVAELVASSYMTPETADAYHCVLDASEDEIEDALAQYGTTWEQATA